MTPGPGQIRALIVDGSNIANSVPDRERMIAALRHLELLVVIDPHLTPTAQLADYVIAPTLQYDRADLPITLGMPLHAAASLQSTPAPVTPPSGSDFVYSWYVFLSLSLPFFVFSSFCVSFFLYVSFSVFFFFFFFYF